MSTNNLSRAGWLSLVIVVLVIGGWELWLRHQGVQRGYDNGKELWADKRARVYGPVDRTTVFIGSSRIMYDLDIPTWRQMTGREAVQLGIEGSTPMPVLDDLANDPDFRGRLVVDVTEELYFDDGPGTAEDPNTDVKYYKERTPAQKAGFALNYALESQFIFLDRYSLSLHAGLERLAPPDRKGVYVFPTFPMEFQATSFDRQNRMWPQFVADTALQHRVQNIWTELMTMAMSAPPSKHDPTPDIIARTAADVEKIRSRGGQVIFVRTPSSGMMHEGEKHGFPRQKFWEPLVTAAHVQGIHFEDNPQTDHFVCPEWSHLTPEQAVAYTRTLVSQLPPAFAKAGN